MAFAKYDNILLTLFIAGLLGGITHCSGMCGPFVLVQSNHISNKSSKLEKISGSLLLPYHLGRMTTYMFLGGLSASFSSQIVALPWQQKISAALIGTSGFIFILSAFPKFKLNGLFKGNILFTSFKKYLMIPIRGLLSNPKTTKGYILGVLLGFLPCGLTFAALMIVSTLTDVFTAVLAMSVFTVGTFPALFVVALGGNLLYNKWTSRYKFFIKLLMAFNGLVLFYIALGMFFNY